MLKIDITSKDEKNLLNSDDMEFYIKYVGRDYQNGYKSYSKSFISNFGIIGYENNKRDKEYSLFY